MKKILVVDDEPFNVELLKGLLSKKYDVETAANGKEAFTKVKYNSPDLILLDVIMPEIDGFTVLKELRTFTKLPVIAFSASPGNQDEALRLGANDFMHKPFDPNVMARRIKALLEPKD